MVLRGRLLSRVAGCRLRALVVVHDILVGSAGRLTFPRGPFAFLGRLLSRGGLVLSQRWSGFGWFVAAEGLRWGSGPERRGTSPFVPLRRGN